MSFTGQYLAILYLYAQLAVNLVQSFGQNSNFLDAWYISLREFELTYKIFICLMFHKIFLTVGKFFTKAI